MEELQIELADSEAKREQLAQDFAQQRLAEELSSQKQTDALTQANAQLVRRIEEEEARSLRLQEEMKNVQQESSRMMQERDVLVSSLTHEIQQVQADFVSHRTKLQSQLQETLIEAEAVNQLQEDL